MEPQTDLAGVGQQIRKSINEVNSQRTGSMGTDDEGLFDVCRFAGARNKPGKSVTAHLNPAVGLMQIMQDTVSWNDNRHVLRNEIENSVQQRVICDPNGTIFGDCQVSAQHCKIDIFELVWIDGGGRGC